jgi:CNT family concentrative nucleoside transporter
MSSTAGAPELWIAPDITLEKILGYVFWPFAWLMGVPADDCYLIAQLLGEKMVVNELVAYSSLAEMLQNPNVELSSRSVVIATYALCGFANFGSIGIQLGGIGGIAPNRKGDLAKIALRAMIGGTLAAFMTATVAGVLV